MQITTTDGREIGKMGHETFGANSQEVEPWLIISAKKSTLRTPSSSAECHFLCKRHAINVGLAFWVFGRGIPQGLVWYALGK